MRIIFFFSDIDKCKGIFQVEMFLSIIIYFVIALFLTINKDRIIQRHQRFVWIVSFFIFIIYTLLTHSYIENPSISYFGNPDQILFYSYSLELSNYTISQIVNLSFSDFDYEGSPGAFVLFALLIKIANSIGIEDILLFLKLNVSFLSSLLIVFVYKIVLLYRCDITDIDKNVLLFAICSPLLFLSCQLMRDIHVCLLYTILAYVALRPKYRFRILLMLFIIFVTYTMRIENGIFAISFM